MTTETERRYSEQWAGRYRGVPDDYEVLGNKFQILHDLFLIAEDYQIGRGLVELAHDRVDEAMTILAGALAPWESNQEESA